MKRRLALTDAEMRAWLNTLRIVSARMQRITPAVAAAMHRTATRNKYRYHDELCGMNDGEEWEIFV